MKEYTRCRKSRNVVSHSIVDGVGMVAGEAGEGVSFALLLFFVLSFGDDGVVNGLRSGGRHRFDDGYQRAACGGHLQQFIKCKLYRRRVACRAYTGADML